MAKECTDHLGNKFKTKTQMAEYWGINRYVLRDRLNKGMSLEEALTTSLSLHSHSCTDHLGNVFNNEKERAAYWNMNVATVKSRIQKGMSLEESLTTPINIKCISYKNVIRKDHLGHEFKSEREMYKAWNIPEKVGQARKKAEWPIEKILTETLKSEKIYTDHLGKTYNSEKAMYNAYGIKEEVGRARKKLGWSIERILTEPVEKTFTDHIGNLFKSEREMYEYWGIPEKIGQWRKKKCWSLEEILTTPPQSFKCTDHLGNIFESEVERANYWGLNSNAVHRRLQKGMSLEKALTTPSCDYKVKYNDPITNKIYTRKDLCKKYNISVGVFRHRIDYGYSLVQALDISMLIPKNTIVRIKQTKYDLTVVKRITKGKDVFECYMDNGDGTSTFKIMTYEMIDQYCLEQYKKLHNTKEEK